MSRKLCVFTVTFDQFNLFSLDKSIRLKNLSALNVNVTYCIMRTVQEFKTATLHLIIMRQSILINISLRD